MMTLTHKMNDAIAVNPAQIKKVILEKDGITLSEFIAVARYKAELTFSDHYVEKIKKSRNLVDRFLSEGRLIYGVTTGLGDNVREMITPEESETLQVNTLRSHAVAVGEPLDEEAVRAIQLMILISFGQGYSGVSFELVDLIKAFLNNQIYPFAPGEGSVGYISVEGHIFLPLIGEGRAWYKGKLLNGDEALKQAGLAPVRLKCKEGLALISGTTSVTALGILALYNAMIVTKSSDIVGAMTYEVLKGTVKALDSRAHQLKMHVEQQETAQNLLAILKNSEIMNKYKDFKVQDSLPLKCMPQTLGAVKRTLHEAWTSVDEEMHSCSDNPIIIPSGDDGEALMCGNFDASYVGIHMDSASIAMGTLAKFSERLTDRLMNRHLNDLPPFLTENPGINNGLMILQYTSAGLVGEIKVLSHPSSVDSIPTCASQEDVVTFAYYASKKAYLISKKLEYIVAIQMMASTEALCFIHDAKPSPVIQKLYKMIRRYVPKVENDRHFYPDIENIKKLIHERKIIECVENETGPLSF
ncbi:MAG: histidine ammonia-lyase [Sporolactobacillus laevolacticus]|jgi:histidine ammonia-lyase|nr:histidine ammonia-lyase [Sporolactobacillus laevolacticus]